MLEGGGGKDLLIFLVTAGIVAPLFSRLRFGVVLGFLLAGMVLGPGGLGSLAPLFPPLHYVTIGSTHSLEALGDLGVIVLLFTIGLDLSFSRVVAMRSIVLRAGGTEVVLAAAAVAAASLAFGLPAEVSIVLGMALALSSTAIVVQTLVEGRRLATETGRTTLGILLLQDLAVVPFVIVVGILGASDRDPTLLVAQGLALAVLVVGLLVVVGRYVMRPLMGFAAATGNRTLTLALALLLLVGTAELTDLVGLSDALGAFLAGLLLAETQYRHQLEVDIEPFKDLLLGVFFLWVGVTIDLTFVLRAFPLVLGCVLAMLALKMVVAWISCRVAIRAAPAVAVEAAFLLAGAGEFAFVLLTLARRDGVIDASLAQLATATAALSMIATPLVAPLGRRLAERLEARRAADRHAPADGGEAFADHVLIGGFGRFGAAVAAILDAEEVPWVALDRDAGRVERARAAGRPVYFGDASQGEMLARLGAARARAFVVTPDQPEAAERMVRAIAAVRPDAVIHARARDRDHALRLAAGGASDVVQEALESSFRIAGHLLEEIGFPEDAVERRIGEARRAAEETAIS
ncbi:cation:proton antiporter [Prosthecomicrobium pneumaticum]|uniref:CPA2 family monovalent cation:H+ antiporter-2 n=1 Tax=Prosthecomicrobium pneumaticum TaxID=81895 RepID=A0A7W9CUB4_9HYPH|nr:cation:proton antiporter [Prosthecomicrobium pneumaticum]MBB5751671.1 CPA2 family monovalent cation:H+ antiporter-2 [Prosthecomicrobium pneumaticum]